MDQRYRETVEPSEQALASRYSEREYRREQAFRSIWAERINGVFADVAKYYDRANSFATLGVIDPLRRRFVAWMDIAPKARVLDVCAGTNAIGRDLLASRPGLEVWAVDRSMAMQQVGRRLAVERGLTIRPTLGDAHALPFPDNHFDAVTLQFATRHLRTAKAFLEIRRVLKPGGLFYHCDMLRPENRIVEELYYVYLRGLLALVPRAFGSGEDAFACREYFVDAIRMFYTVRELSHLLEELGFKDVRGRAMLGGTVGFHRARKPLS